MSASGLGRKRVQFGYGLNYLIDIANAVIIDVEATPARTYDEVAATKTMLTRTEQRLGLKAKRLVADTAYGTGTFLGWLIEAGITPHIPVWDKSNREDGTLSRVDFAFDSDHDLYVCPAGKLLKTTGSIGVDHVVRYRALKKLEMRFAHLKTHHRFERMRLRGLSGARDEFHLAAIVQNLKTARRLL